MYMKDDPRKYWSNIPNEIPSETPGSKADILRRDSSVDTTREALEAGDYNSNENGGGNSTESSAS